MNPVLHTLLLGTYDPESSLFALRRLRGSLLRHLWKEYVVPMYENALCHVLRGSEALEPRASGMDTLTALRFHPPLTAFPVFEPESPKRVLNLPFDAARIRETLPSELHAYIPLIQQCVVSDFAGDSVWYLTVDEGFVEAGCTQRRPGLHTESTPAKSVPCIMESRYQHLHFFDSWGIGALPLENYPVGGVFIASSVAATCAIYACSVKREHIGAEGNVEHLRAQIEQAHRFVPAAGELFWMTDSTPHEALPMPKSGPRQFFRVVAGNLSTWYADRYTHNPSVKATGRIVNFHGE